MKTMYDINHKPITSICLNLTDDCNFNCKYCFVNKNPNYMSYKIAQDSLNWIQNNIQLYNLNTKPSITFFGGEPTLLWDEIIEPLVINNSEVEYNITTNGFLLDEKKIDFLSKYNFSVMLSMDGDEQTQNYNRCVNSFEKLDKIIPYLLNKVKNVRFRGTIIPATCKNTYQNILYAQQKGFKSCYFTINIFEKWEQDNWNDLEEEIKKFFFIYLNSFVNEKQIINFTPFTNMVNLIIRQEVGVLDNQINKYKCGLGNGYGAINYKGDIYTCQEIVTYTNNNEQFKIGNIYSGMNYKKIYELEKNIINNMPIVNNKNNNCQECPLNFCCKKNMCQINNYICNNHCLVQSYNQCQWNLLLYKYASLAISILQTLPNFQNYMKNIILEKEE